MFTDMYSFCVQPATTFDNYSDSLFIICISYDRNEEQSPSFQELIPSEYRPQSVSEMDKKHKQRPSSKKSKQKGLWFVVTTVYHYDFKVKWVLCVYHY